MLRLAIMMIVGGGIFAYLGAQEFLLDRKASAEPVAVDLAKLESGKAPDNPHVKVGEHVAIYSVGVYEYRKTAGANGVNARTEITEYFYPLISDEHPFLRGLKALVAKHGGLENVPDDAEWPQVDSFRVLVKTTRFGTVGEIPQSMERVDSIQGVFINTIDPLDSKTKELLRQQFPNVDVDKVLVLQEGRAPSGLAWGLVKVIGPAAIALVGVFLLIPRRQRQVIQPETAQWDSPNPIDVPNQAPPESPSSESGGVPPAS